MPPDCYREAVTRYLRSMYDVGTWWDVAEGNVLAVSHTPEV